MQVPGQDPGTEKGHQWKPGVTQIVCGLVNTVDVNFSALTKVPLLCLMFMGGRYRDSALCNLAVNLKFSQTIKFYKSSFFCEKGGICRFGF